MCRQRGDLPGSLSHFQQAMAAGPSNPDNAKQVGRSLALLGRHFDALELYRGLLAAGVRDWHVMHNKGVCHVQLGQLREAEECLLEALSLQRHTVTFLQLSKVQLRQGDRAKAAETLKLALKLDRRKPFFFSFSLLLACLLFSFFLCIIVFVFIVFS